MIGPLEPVVGKYPSTDGNDGMGDANNDIIKHKGKMRGPLGPVVGRYLSTDGNGGIGDANNDIIKHNRKCRDVVFLVVFCGFWVAMIVNSSFGFSKGNPLRLNYGLDYNGNLCGEKHAEQDLRELGLRYWLNPNQVYQTSLKDSKFELSNARSICLMDCPVPSEDSLNWVCDYPEGDVNLSLDDWIDRNYDYFADLTPQLRNTSLQLQGPCYPVIFPSVNVYWSCQFMAHASNVSLRNWEEMGGVKVIDDIAVDKSIHKSINSQSSVLKRYVADVGKAWPVLLLCGGFLPLFLSILWLLMIRYFVSGMPWITVALFSICIVFVTMFYYLKGCKSSSCGFCPHDRCDDYFSPICYCYSPSHTYGNICPQGCCEGHWRYTGTDNFSYYPICHTSNLLYVLVVSCSPSF